LIKESSIPYTILRSTQFFEFMERVGQSGFDGENIRVSSAQVQPIAADDVVAALANVATGAPANATLEVAGPEPLHLDQIVRQVLTASQDPRSVIADASAPYFGTVLDDKMLTPGAAALLGTTHFEDWLSTNGPRPTVTQPPTAKSVASASP
jgi:uncharacterized protein YbjT (DUF2867 family)